MRWLLTVRVVLGAILLLFVTMPVLGQEKTFTVTVEQKTSEHPYFGEGNSEGFVIDGTQGKELTLEKGKTYDFEMGSSVGSFHPFYISTDAVGAGAGTYSKGVQNNEATAGETLTFAPPTDAPDSLWYQCDNHRKMGWQMALVEDSARAVVGSNGKVSFTGTGVAINFSGTSGSDTVTVDKFNSAPDSTSGISKSNVSKYRFIIEAGGSLSFDSNTEVRLDVDSLGGIGDPSNVTIYKRPSPGSGGSFTALSTFYDSNTEELWATTGSFSEFVLASDTEPLPVELVGFEARVEGGKVRLRWLTASETNNAGFRVQRRVSDASTPGVRREGTAENGREGEWKQVGLVEGNGTTTEAQRYRFTDANLPYEADRLTYRLKQVDTDGTTYFSKTVTVRRGVDEVELLGTAPNPAARQATVRYALSKKQEVTVELYDVLGRKVQTVVSGKRKGRSEAQLDVSSLPSGVYFLRLRAGGQARTRKLTVVE